jgi:hypothetical protein
MIVSHTADDRNYAEAIRTGMFSRGPLQPPGSY